MDRIIRQVCFPEQNKPRLKRVAAYARVSSGKDAMLHSLSAQVSFYSEFIQNHAGWQYCGVYSDEAFTGTKENRQGFQDMIADCRAGKLDMVITKSISRFARNTVSLLQAVRELKQLGVDVYFEEQNIHTVSSEGELMMTILASYAQEESLSASENQKWRVRRNFGQGIPWNGTIFGYRLKSGQYEVVSTEAKIVQRIYSEYLSGRGKAAIAKGLNDENITSRYNKHWCKSEISKILSNYTYTGNLILQKTYSENHITKRRMLNEGQFTQYHIEDSHPAIVEMQAFIYVQQEMLRRSTRSIQKPAPKRPYPFSKLLVCANCGKHYRRKYRKSGPVWICSTYDSIGKSACNSKQIPESTLDQVVKDAMNLNTISADILHSLVSYIKVSNGNHLLFALHDGSEFDCVWNDRSRSQSWTAEMKESARQNDLKRRLNNG